MELPEVFVDFVLQPAYKFIDYSHTLVKGAGPSIHIARIAQSILEYSGSQGSKLLTALDDVVQFAPFRNFISRTHSLITGRAAGFRTHDRLVVNGYYHDNYINIASKICLLVADSCGSLIELNKLDILPLGAIANAVASIPVFGVVGTLIIDDVRDAFGIAGLSLGVLDGLRHMKDYGFSLWASSKIIGSICKIAFIVLSASGQYLALAWIANATASALYLTRHMLRVYRVESWMNNF